MSSGIARYGCLGAIVVLALIVGVQVGKLLGAVAGLIAFAIAALVLFGMSRRFMKGRGD